MSCALASLLCLACSSSAAQSGGHTAVASPVGAGQAEAVFAGGCFWCMEGPFERIDGVVSVESGYTGGQVVGPSYEQVSSGGTGHAESIRVVFDPERVTYQQLLDVFWHNVDPTQANGQFCDHGTQYRSAIFPIDAEQRRLAEASLAAIQRQLGRSIVTRIEPHAPFYVAEDYHQNYYRTHPADYQRYRLGCGRDRRLEAVWGSAPAH